MNDPFKPPLPIAAPKPTVHIPPDSEFLQKYEVCSIATACKGGEARHFIDAESCTPYCALGSGEIPGAHCLFFDSLAAEK